MKKITISLLLLIFVLRVMGQTTAVNAPNGGHIPYKIPTNVAKLPTSKSNSASRGASNKFLWLNYGLAQLANYGTSVASGTFLFPDSNVHVFYSNAAQTGDTVGDPFVHEIGNIFDPYSYNMSTGYGFPQITTNVPYTLDSIGLGMVYSRHDTLVTDTLVFYFFQAALNSKDIPVYYYADNSQSANYWFDNFGYDTVRVPFQNYNYKNNILADNSAAITTVKIPLTEADTSVTFFHTKVFALPTPVNVSAGNFVSAAFTFKPGYSYTPFENIDSLENVVTFESLDEVAGGVPYYVPGDDYNVSSIVTTADRYNKDAGYDGLFIPSFAYLPGFTLDDHMFFYHIGYDSTLIGAGVNHISNAVLNQSINPNPAADFATLNYTLKTTASVVINVFDITGRLVTSMNEGNVIAGENRQILDTQNLTNGIYMVSIEANGISSVSKLVVNR